MTEWEDRVLKAAKAMAEAEGYRWKHMSDRDSLKYEANAVKRVWLERAEIALQYCQ